MENFEILFGFVSQKNGLCLKNIFHLEDLMKETYGHLKPKIVESNFQAPVSQVVAWRELGQCLINLKTNFRASIMTIITHSPTPFISGVCATPLSTSLLFLTVSPRKSVQRPQAVFTVLLGLESVWTSSLLAPHLQGWRLKIISPKTSLLMSTHNNNFQEHKYSCIHCYFVLDIILSIDLIIRPIRKSLKVSDKV